ncbi:cytochrome P450 [Streptomyces sp. NPDC058701]|uniref:cytochrome P450 n=1 Tax=Streptomyces sp. NPDC058701 TaxID=3346608 RepID=UPI0036684393
MKRTDVTSIDFTDPEIIGSRFPHPEFEAARRAAPVLWCPQERGVAGFDDEGYWAVVRHAEADFVARNPELFSSYENSSVIRFDKKTTRDEIMLLRFLMSSMNGAEHTRLRSIVKRGFTPRALKALEHFIQTCAHRTVLRAAEKLRAEGRIDFVKDIADELPLQVISELMDIPEADRPRIFALTNAIIAPADFATDQTDKPGPAATAELLTYASRLAEQRAREPGEDIVSGLVAAQLAGNLSPDEFGFFFVLLSIAGSETTRHAISGGMLAFLDHHEQWELYMSQRPSTAAREVVRYSSPAIIAQRTATRDVELAGTAIRAGDRLGIFYASANFDDAVFEEPYRFDVLRDPNPHLGFGSGPHYCLGKKLAEMEVDAIFAEVADLMPRLRLCSPPSRYRSGWMNGCKSMIVARHTA